jgi:dTDP-4-amino-4,6-dideoxygalactose transaminase
MSRIGLRELYTLTRVVSNGQLLRYSRGDQGYTSRFETELANITGANYVLTVNSGTNALITALAAAGIGPGDEVLVPAYTWVSTALAPLAVGAVPVLVNINETLTIDPVELEERITLYTKAIIPVHMVNSVCDMDAIMDIAKRHNLLVIEDACQCVGVTYKGHRVGAIGDLGAFSFNHYKNMTSGEGGAVLTDREPYYTRARMYHDPGDFIRGHGGSSEPVFSGFNFRVSELTGAMLHVQLAKLDRHLQKLRVRQKIMHDALGDIRGFHISPHNDPDNAVSLGVLFENEADAKIFSKNRSVTRLIDTDRHVFKNWEAVLSKRSFHPKMNPHNWTHRNVEYNIEDYSKTLDILKRTCKVALGAQYPVFFMRYWASVLRKNVMKTSKRSV